MAIEAKDFTEKDELISKFYTIRAGLSVIAEENEKIRNAQAEVEKLKQEDEIAIKRRIIELEDEKCSLRYEINKKQKSIEHTEIMLDCYKIELDGLRHEGNKNFGPKFPVGLTIFLSTVVFIILMSIGLSLSSEAGQVFFAFLAFAGIPIVIVSLVRKNNKKGDDLWLIAVREQENKVKTAEADIERFKASIKENHRKIEEIDNVKIPQLDSFSLQPAKIASFEKNVDSITYCATMKAKAIRNSLLQAYSHIITEDDWGNIDLLIFYLYTGRADSLKEALQLVDRQRQTNQIASAIHSAAYYISTTIENNTYKLARMIDSSFTELSQQIDRNHQEMLSTVGTIGVDLNSNLSTLTSTMINLGGALLDAHELNASLLKEANQSSDRLMYELRYNQKLWIK